MKIIRCAILITMLSTPVHAGWWWNSDPEPQPRKIDLSNIRDVVSQLMPLTDGNYLNVSVYVWGNGNVNIHVKTRSGSGIRGSGTTIEAALQDMAKSSSGVSAALAPLLPTQ